MIKYVKSGGTETLTETCEHCEEPARTLHISEITSKAEGFNGTMTIRDKDNNNFTLKKKSARIAEITASFIRKGLLSVDEAAVQKEGLKYGLRAEAMCSESIDIIAGVTQSFCYRIDNSKFLAKKFSGISLSSSFHNESEILTDDTGSKVGVDRNGNVIRLKKYKRIDMETGVAEPDSAIKFKGPETVTWWRELKPVDQEYLIRGAQSIEGYVRRYGKEVKDMTVVARYRNRDAFIEDVNRNVVRGETSLR